MIANISSAEPISTDARLVESVLKGDREAFAELVTKYQNPIAAFAYSGCGDVARSEDLAQETFIIAWRKLSDLKEPAKFKSWLFGIARNLIYKSVRRETHNPLAASDQLDENLTSTASAANPTEHAITKEEQAILWQALENIPEPYREPLVLFYREHQSIQRVAETLELTEEATRQRLSRGRKLLHERVVAFVEGALERTAPNPQFTAGVMAALPGITAATTLTATTVKGAAGKTATSIGLKTLLGPFLWLLGAVAATWAFIFKLPNSSRERKFAAKAWAVLWLWNIAFAVGMWLISDYGDWANHRKELTLIMAGSMIPYGLGLATIVGVMMKRQSRIRKEESGKSIDPGFMNLSEPYEWRSRRSFLGIPLVHVRFNLDMKDKTAAKGWIAIGTRAYGLLFAAGAFCVAPISWGALAIGVIGLGGVGIGVLAFGGFSLGFAAMGGCAIGYIAFGGGTIGWLGAAGGVPIAHDYAVGGAGIAAHVNDAASRLFMRDSIFFRYAEPVTVILICVSWIPILAMVWFKKRFGKPAKT